MDYVFSLSPPLHPSSSSQVLLLLVPVPSEPPFPPPLGKSLQTSSQTIGSLSRDASVSLSTRAVPTFLSSLLVSYSFFACCVHCRSKWSFTCSSRSSPSSNRVEMTILVFICYFTVTDTKQIETSRIPSRKNQVKTLVNMIGCALYIGQQLYSLW